MRRLAHQLWAVPLGCVALCLVVAVAAVAIDRAHPDLVPTTLTGTPSGAQTVLTTIASSMITLVTLVLTVVTVGIQLAMGQFSPRIVQALLRDRGNRLSFGLFGGTAVFTTLAAIQVDDQRGFVPGLTVLLAYALTLASLVVLVLYVDRAGRALRVSGLIDLVGDNLHGQLAARFPDRLADLAPDDPAVVSATEAGEVVRIQHGQLVEEAERAGCLLELVPAMGDFVPNGAPLLRVHGDAGRVDPDRLRRLVGVADERTHDTDPAYGFRKLVDIATRSARQDPTTTVQAVHRLHDALRHLAVAELPDGRHRDAAGELRLLTREVTWDGYVRLAFDEVRTAGASQPQVGRRLRSALVDLKAITPESRHAVLDYELGLLEAGVRRALDADDDIASALTPDGQGIGSGPDVSRVGDRNDR
ncbi:MAG TPA: DUF2254 domain-containing protein [Acidimicrobiales bacterium]|nr:DUF2254 domain-containing protein [Acidimicrobiales bacterium]